MYENINEGSFEVLKNRPHEIKSGVDKIWKGDGKDKLLGQSAISTFKFIIVTHYL